MSHPETGQGRRWLRLGALSGFTAVALGAFGAHALKSRLTPDMLAIFETGVRYQMYHALALLAVGILANKPGTAAGRSGLAFALGTLVFSGSLYLLALTGQRWLGAITPIGGLLYLAGWLNLVMVFGRRTPE
ncbi:MAG TPA: DUF423 domain-containing protein [Candidatus Eisenbacteria bacterium]